jgi:hypothetical protein
MNIQFTIVLALVAMSDAPRVVEPQQSGIIARLSPETYEQAKQCGRAGEDCAITPYQLCRANEAFSAQLATPFSRVAAGVFESVTRNRRPDPMPLGAANGWGVGIYVGPAEKSSKPDAIQSVELRRRDRTIKPLRSTVAPITATLPDGTVKQLTRGFFSFPVGALDPSADVTVVLNGTTGSTTCLLEGSRLQSLR